jgi:hypothetical protein
MVKRGRIRLGNKIYEAKKRKKEKEFKHSTACSTACQRV